MENSQSARDPLDKVQDSQHQLRDMLHISIPMRVALPINDAILQPARIPAMCTPTLKEAKKRYYVLPQRVRVPIFLSSIELMGHPGSIRKFQQHPRSNPSNREDKRLDLMGRKVFSSAGLQFHISNYLAPMNKYDFNNCGQLAEFTDKLPHKIAINSRQFCKKARYSPHLCYRPQWTLQTQLSMSGQWGVLVTLLWLP